MLKLEKLKGQEPEKKLRFLEKIEIPPPRPVTPSVQGPTEVNINSYISPDNCRVGRGLNYRVGRRYNCWSRRGRNCWAGRRRNCWEGRGRGVADKEH